MDVTSTAEAGLLATSDEDQLAYALAQRRVVVTHDADFLRIAAAGLPSPGVVFSPAQGRSLGQLIHDLLLIWEAYEPEEMRNRVEFI